MQSTAAKLCNKEEVSTSIGTTSTSTSTTDSTTTPTAVSSTTAATTSTKTSHSTTANGGRISTDSNTIWSSQKDEPALIEAAARAIRGGVFVTRQKVMEEE